MTELGYVTLPRGRRLPPTPNSSLLQHHHHHYAHTNGHLPSPHHTYKNSSNNNNKCHAIFQLPTTTPVGNGGVGSTHVVGNGLRAIHDGFATIRSGGNKRGRSRSSPSVTLPPPTSTTSTPSPCHHPCCHPGTPPTWTMEPLWEERGSGGRNVEGQTATVARRDRSQLPWWEVATRRSKYRSCPAFSQASMVSVLEQTMTSVTNRLERLASSPDLKETEAAELRKTAAVLRQQSSAVCQSVSSGCPNMERQLSCDSVSSVTSSVSGASLSSYASLGSHSLSAALTPHCSHLNHTHATQPDAINATTQAKLKKRSWLRSSFRRAFGRHGRKRKQGDGPPEDSSQELPLHHTVNSAVRYLPTPPFLQQTGQLKKCQVQQKPKKQQNVFEESEVLCGLQQEVGEKERALTEARLEVLSAQHQLQAQADTITRLQAEVVGLREENKRLAGVAREQHGPQADLLSPLTHTFSSLTLKPHTPKGLSVLNPREVGRQVKILLVNQPGITLTSQASHVTVDPCHLTHIGNINVGSRTTWDELDTMVVNTLKDYGNCIDPVYGLGVEFSGCLLCYRVEGVVCGPSLPRPELLPCGYCVGHVDSLHIWLKGGQQKQDGENIGSLSSACFSSLTPAPTLTPLASLLLAHPRLVLAGPPASGKTHLAITLAHFMLENSGCMPNEVNIKVFKVTGNNSLELCQFLSSIWPRGLSTSAHSTSSLSSTFSTHSSISCTSSPISTSSTLSPNSPILSAPSPTLSASSITSIATNVEPCPSSPPAVIILDDLHAAGGVVETLQRCLPTTLHTGPAIIATCCPTSTLATRLQIHCNFRWTSLSIQQEPVRGLLGRVLRRKVAAAEVAANTKLPDAHHLAEWLTRLWLHLNTLLSGHCGSNDTGIGPGCLMDCPLGQEETQAWFTEVWNTRLVPQIVSTMRASATGSTAILDAWTDPLDWVLATYPWPNNAACGPDQLTRIPATDIRQEEMSLSVSRATASHRPYVPFSVHQQNLKTESVYAVPQLLPRSSPVSLRTNHATGQTFNISEPSHNISNSKQIHNLLTAEQSLNIHSNGQTVTASNTGQKSKMVTEHPWYKTVNEINDNLATIRRARSKSCTTSGPKPLTVARNDPNINGNQLILTSGTGNNEFPMFMVGRLSNGTRSHENVSNHKTSVLTLASRDKLQSIVKDEVQMPTEDEDDVMESDCLMDNASDDTDESDLQSFKSADSRQHNLNLGSKPEVAMDTDSNPQLYNTGPQTLDVLAKNVLNNNGLSPECVKIIRGAGSKIDLKGLARELTTTFKPVESAI